MNVFYADMSPGCANLSTGCITAANTKLSSYNTRLSELDGILNELETAESELDELSARMLAGVGVKYGKNSDEYEKAGGTRTDERKPIRRKSAPVPA